nr:hypothetical protein [Rhizobium anhuiense]
MVTGLLERSPRAEARLEKLEAETIQLREENVALRLGTPGRGANFTVFRTTKSKSRLNLLSLLRGNYQDYVLNDAFDYLKERRGEPVVVAGLRTFEPQRFCKQVPFMAHLADKGIDIFDRQEIGTLAEAGIWGAIRHHGLIGNTVIVSDDAGQFRVGNHALCWVHLERLLQKLMPSTPGEARHVETIRDLIWRFYRA